MTGIGSLLGVMTIDSGLWPCLNTGLSQSDWVTLERYATFLNLNFLFWKWLGWFHRRKLWGEIKQYRSAVRHRVPDKRSAVFAAPIIMILHVFYVGKFCQKENIMHENLDLYESQIGEISAWDKDCPVWPGGLRACDTSRLGRWVEDDKCGACLEPGHCRQLRRHAVQK